MKIELLDYHGRRKAFDIPEKEEIHAAFIQIYSGDETLNVITRDGNTSFYDSSDSRMIDYDDGMYIVYGPGVDKFADPKWLARTSADEGETC